jgi:hypothetical protein
MLLDGADVFGADVLWWCCRYGDDQCPGRLALRVVLQPAGTSLCPAETVDLSDDCQIVGDW